MGNKSMRGQSAMEYLMTYGWALLVIVIVIAVLAMIFSGVKAPEQCLFEPGFTCASPRLISTFAPGVNNVLFADVMNGQQQSIKVAGIACVKGKANPPANWWQNTNFAAVRTMEYQGLINLGNYSEDGAGAGVIKQTKCYDNWGTTTSSGGAPTALATTTNQDFSGYLYVAYRMADDNPAIPPKVTKASLTTRSQ